jgi:GNAT superfamily N-acetyltransferase
LRILVKRLVEQVNRAKRLNRMVLLYCDLSNEICGSTDLPASIVVERKRSVAELNHTDFQELINFWNPRLARQHIRRRLKQDASLWLMKVDGSVAGCVWTLQGRTMEPYFFRLGQDDVHLFDGYVAPSFRGRGLHSVLLNYVLRNLARENMETAFSEIAEWNYRSFSSVRTTPLRRLGSARKLTIGSQTIVWWNGD